MCTLHSSARCHAFPAAALKKPNRSSHLQFGREGGGGDALLAAGNLIKSATDVERAETERAETERAQVNPDPEPLLQFQVRSFCVTRASPLISF